MNSSYLSFEQPIAELEAKIEELRLVGTETEVNLLEEITRLKKKSNKLTKSIFSNLSAWQITQLARHPLRPYTLDYITRIFTEFDELHGDRAFSDDRAIVGGIARLEGEPVMIIGQQKGRDTAEKLRRNFGMVHPEGYRRAKRLMELAEKFSLPVITFIDTLGAYPGMEAEARGQSEAIARNLFCMAQLNTPIIVVVIGEGCSGGALGIGMGDRLLMLQYSYYATISPEGCASILFKNAEKAADVADMMGLTAERLLAQGFIDTIVPEPLGGAHRDVEKMSSVLKSYLIENLQQVKRIPLTSLVEKRYERWMAMGQI